MHRGTGIALSILLGCLAIGVNPALADCISCGTRAHISTPFLNDLAEVNPPLAGAVWAGISEANSGLKNDRTEVKGTMGKEGKSYTYLSRVRLLADGSISLTVRVEEDGAGRVQDYEGTLTANGKSGRFVQVGAKGRIPVYSWDTH